MDRTQEIDTANLLDLEGRLVATLLRNFRDLIKQATSPVGSSASPGQAAFSNMAMDIETKGLIKSAEDLLQLTRLLRELWIIGPLHKPGEGEAEAEATIGEEVQSVVGVLSRMREKSRRELVDLGMGQAVLGQGSYTTAASDPKV